MLMHRAWLMAASLIATSAFVACGARTGLDETISVGGSAPDAGRTPRDAGHDVVHIGDCDPDSGLSTFIWVIAADGKLFRFHPEFPSSFEELGHVDCSYGDPNSMAVTREGKAYVAYATGHLATLSVEEGNGGTGGGFPSGPPTIKCSPTHFAVDQLGFKTFGMGFATDENGPAETLYVAQGDYKHPSKGLAKIDVETDVLEFIAPFSPDLGDAVELTGTGDGRLFGVFLSNPGPGAHLVQIDKTNGQLLNDRMLPVGASTSDLAVAFFGGDFYIFTGDLFGTTVTRYVYENGASTIVATLANEGIVGAGVSTCAPLVPAPLGDTVGEIKSR